MSECRVTSEIGMYLVLYHPCLPTNQVKALHSLPRVVSVTVVEDERSPVVLPLGLVMRLWGSQGTERASSL